MSTDGDTSNMDKTPVNTIIAAAVRQRVFVLAAVALIAVTGIFALRGLVIDVFPDPSPALVQIYTEAEGLAPEEVEQLISYPVEAAMFGLPKVDKVRSFSTYGLSVVSVYFADRTDIHWARQLIAPRLHEIQDVLPPQAGEPFLGPIATGLGMVYLYYLEGDGYTTLELRTIQDWLIKYELQSVPEVSEVLSIGGDVAQYEIQVDPKALLKYDIPLETVMERVREGNRNAGAGFITRGPEEIIVRSIGLVQQLEDLQDIVVASASGTPVLLSDVAHVDLMPAIKRGAAVLDDRGERVVGMVLKLFGSNTARVIQNLEERIEEVGRALPPGVEIVPLYNQAAFVRACYTTVGGSLLAGILLVVVVLTLFMGRFRPALLTVMSLPFSMLLAFIIMNRVGLAADLMTFGGLAISIGLIADAAIIMVENIHRLHGEGLERGQAIRQAGEEVARPLFFAITIIILVFLPIFTLQGQEGIMFRPMGYAISAALAGSLLFALVVAPAAAWFTLGRGNARESRGPTPVFRLVQRMYFPLFDACRRRRKLVFSVTGVVVVAGLILLPFMGREYMPTLREGSLHLSVSLEPNTSIEESIRMAEVIGGRLRQLPEVTAALSRIGRGETGSHVHFVNELDILITMRPMNEWEAWHDLHELQHAIEDELADLPGISLNLTQPIQHNLDHLLTGVQSQVAVRLFGEDFDTLRQSSREIETVLAGIPGAADVQTEIFTGLNSIQLDVDRKALARYGLTVSHVQQTIEAALGGVTLGQVYDGPRRFNIFLRYQPEYRNDPDRLESLLVSLPDGGYVPLGLLASIQETTGPRHISRENSRRYITVQANVRGRDMGRFVEEAQEAVRASVDLPPGYLVRWGGQFELQERSRRVFMLVTPLTLALVTLLLYSIFQSGREAAVMLINVPVAVTGGLLALKLTGQHISVPASIGFIAIFGIAMQDGLVLLATIRRALAKGRSAAEAVRYGVEVKLLPVIMTTCTTIFGVLPLLLARGPGAEIQRPLATVVVGGLVTSTLVTLIVLPLVYETLTTRGRLLAQQLSPDKPGSTPSET